MGKIIAIGGGSIGQPDHLGMGYLPVETTAIDQESIKRTHKEHPKVLFIPTASRDNEAYYRVVKEHFEGRLGCITDVLYLNDSVSPDQVRDNIFGNKEILSADMVYVGGGDTTHLLKTWKERGVDVLLKQAHKEGIVLSGLSAGAICWFKYAVTDSDPVKGTGNFGYSRIDGLGLFPLTLIPHYTPQGAIALATRNVMSQTQGVAIGLEDNCALEILGQSYRFLHSDGFPDAKAYKVFALGKKVVTIPQEPQKAFRPLEELTATN